MMKPEPAARVVSWMEREPASSLYVTSITQTEIMHGVLLLPAGGAGVRRSKLPRQAMFSEDFAERLLAFGSEARTRLTRILRSNGAGEGVPIAAFRRPNCGYSPRGRRDSRDARYHGFRPLRQSESSIRGSKPPE